MLYEYLSRVRAALEQLKSESSESLQKILSVINKLLGHSVFSPDGQKDVESDKPNPDLFLSDN